jgi:hypothetical protein
MTRDELEHAIRAACDAAGDKDRELVRILLREKVIKPNRLVRLINLLPVEEERRGMLRRWVDGTVRNLTRKAE